MIFLYPPEKFTHVPRVSAIQFYNSLTNQTETEKVYGESFLSFAYGNPLGKIALHSYIKRPGFSQWYGSRMNRASSRQKIQPFIDTYGLSVDDFADPVSSFANFNQFFYRKLKPSARPIDADPRSIVFPADGRHLAFPNASAIDSVFVKGQKFDLSRLLQSEQLAARYRQGALVLSRLCPVDYHRFHFPYAGAASHTKLINGPLFSVSPLALRKNLSYFWQNKRTITELRTADIGTVLILEIGATCVGSIHQTYRSSTTVDKGQEKGYFAFGGSSTILLFEPGVISLDPALCERSKYTTETYALMGSPLGYRR